MQCFICYHLNIWKHNLVCKKPQPWNVAVLMCVTLFFARVGASLHFWKQSTHFKILYRNELSRKLSEKPVAWKYSAKTCVGLSWIISTDSKANIHAKTSASFWNISRIRCSGIMKEPCNSLKLDSCKYYFRTISVLHINLCVSEASI